MAKLPGEQDIGPLPTAIDPSIDTGAIARGGAAIGQGFENLGKGIGVLGQGAASLGLDEQRFDYAKAHSYLLSGIIDQDTKTQQDTNPQPDATGQPLTVRHENAVGKLQTDAAAMVPAGPMRDRFMTETAHLIAKSNAEAQTHARNLDNSASVAWVDQAGNDAISKGIATTDDDTRRALIDNHNQLIDGLVAKGAITPVQAFQAKQAWAQQFTKADWWHRGDTDPQGVLNTVRAAPGSGQDITNRILRVEGSGKSTSSSAQGAGQFIDSTWLDVLKRNRPDLAQGHSDQELLALRADRQLGAQMTEAYRAENEAALKKAGVEATPGAQYLAHFLGAGAAAAVLKADPNMPVADVLAKTVGPQKAQAMIAANPSILNGQLAGSVTKWADGKMGGSNGGSGALYTLLSPVDREEIAAHAQTQLQKQNVDTLAMFKGRVEDNETEAAATGGVKQEIPQSEFIAHLGAQLGPQAYKQHQAIVQAGHDAFSVAKLDPQEQTALLQSYTPKPGEGYAAGVQRYTQIADAIKKTSQEKKDDAGGFAINRLPATGDAYNAFAQASVENRPAAARQFAATTLMEQGRVGIPAAQQAILPKAYVDQFNKEISGAANSDDPQKRIGLVARVQQEAALWGDNWPQVMRQLAPASQPIVRAIAAGADPNAMVRLLNLDKTENPVKILKEQNETKFNDLTKSLNDAMAPFRQSLVGRQMDRDFPAYYGLAEKLGALHVRDGDSATDAATKSFNELIGNRYDFRDTWRIPKSAGISADDVQRGTLAARAMFSGGSQIYSNFGTATAEMKMTPQEQALYQRHLNNLTGPGGVDNPDGSRSSLMQMSVERDGKTYNVPTVYDGKILPPAEAMKRAEQEGLDKFPSYGSEAEAEARYGQMHTYMDKDTQQFLAARKSNPFGATPPADDMPGRSNAAATDQRLVGRDAAFVTDPTNSGLNMSYNGKFVRGADGVTPLLLPWSQLAKMGQTFTPAKRESMARHGVSSIGRFAD